MNDCNRDLKGVRRVPEAELGRYRASHGIVGIDTMQVLHPYELSPEAMEHIRGLTGGCEQRRSNPPWGSGLTINEKAVRFPYYSKVQNPTDDAIAALQATQNGVPVAISQIDLAADLYFAGDLQALQASWVLIERHNYGNQLSVLRDTMFCDDGYYIGLRSDTRRQTVYWKATPAGEQVIRLELRFRGSRAVKSLFRRCNTPLGDYVSLEAIVSLDLVDAFQRCLDFRTLDEQRLGLRLTRSARAHERSRPPTDFYERVQRAVAQVRRMASNEFWGPGPEANQPVTVLMECEILRQFAPWFAPEFLARLRPQDVGLPNSENLQLGRLLP